MIKDGYCHLSGHWDHPSAGGGVCGGGGRGGEGRGRPDSPTPHPLYRPTPIISTVNYVPNLPLHTQKYSDIPLHCLLNPATGTTVASLLVSYITV